MSIMASIQLCSLCTSSGIENSQPVSTFVVWTTTQRSSPGESGYSYIKIYSVNVPEMEKVNSKTLPLSDIVTLH